MQLALPVELLRYLDDAVARGEFASHEELIVDAVRRHREYAAKLQNLRDDLQLAIDELDRGEGITISNEEEHRKYWAAIRRKVLEEREAGVTR